jgi:hypothetical protein
MKKSLFLFITMSILLMVSGAMSADIPMMMNYQGYVETAGGAPLNGACYFKFAIIDSPSSPTISYWSNDDTSTAGSQPNASVEIPVSNGIFTVKLGKTPEMEALPATAFEQQNVYVRVWFSNDDSTFEQLSEDTQVLSAGFAYKAQTLAVTPRELVVKSAGTEIGMLAGTEIGIVGVEGYGAGMLNRLEGFVINVINSKGYIFGVSPLTGQIIDLSFSGAFRLYYSGPNCQGQKYMQRGLNGLVYLFEGTLNYIGKEAIPSQISYGSQYPGTMGTCENYAGTKDLAWDVYPNNSSVTGVNSATFATPITVDIK